MIFLSIKTLHIISAFLLFGTGLGSAFYKYMADRGTKDAMNGSSHELIRNLENLVMTNKNVVLADWLFTTPTVIIQPVTGIIMANMMNLPLTTPWIMLSLILYGIAGLCWLPVVVLQIRMRDISRQALNDGTALPEQYHRYARPWFWLGVSAFMAISLVIVLMVFKGVFFNRLA